MIEIKDKSKCCGCSACVNICPKQCISFDEDIEGFRYPNVDLIRCVNCNLCEKVCPVINQNDVKRPQKVYASKNINEEIRLQSSSGGVFSLLAELIIIRGGVVFGARFDENWEVIHDYAETKKGLTVFRGSKYVQSRIGNTYQQVEDFLKSGREVMFTGTPCQVAGLKRYLRREYYNLLTVDIVCHGVPSPLVWREYLKKNSREQNIIAVNFRSKIDGWKKYKVVVEGQKSDIVNEPYYNNIYMQGFLRDIYLRPSCYACPAKYGKSRSDITLGDFWGIENYLPNFDDNKGISLVLLQSQKGLDFYNTIETYHIEVDYEKALAGNPAIEKSAKCNSKFRRMFWNSEDKISNISRVVSKVRPSFARRCFRFAKCKIKMFFR